MQKAFVFQMWQKNVLRRESPAGQIDEYITIDRYTGAARVSSRLIAYANTINNRFEDRYTCTKGKAKKKF